MSARPPALLLLLLALAAPLWAGDAATAAAAPAHPPLSVLSDEEYAAGAKRILDGCDRAKLQASTEPEAGMLVVQLTKGGQGEQLGIVPGEVITALEGAPLPTGYALNNHRTNQPQHLTIRSPSGEERTVTIAPGKIGLGFRDLVWRPELTYLRRPGRVAAFDDDMLVACLAGAAEADLRETALAHVAAAGGQPPLWLSLATWVAVVRGHYDDAIGYGFQALEHDTDFSAGWRVGTLIFKAAIAGDRLSTARAIIPKLVASPIDTMTSEAVIAMLEAKLEPPGAAPTGKAPAAKTPVKPPPLKAPVAAAEGLERRAEALSELAGHMLAGDDDGGLAAIRQLGTGRTLRFLSPGTQEHFHLLGPYGRNCSLKGTLTFQVTETDRLPGQPAPVVRFGIYDASQTTKIHSLCSLNLLDQKVLVYQEDLPSITLDCGTRVGPDCANHLRISAIDDRTEMVVNGVTVFLGAITNAPTRRLGMFFTVRGVNGALEGLSWKIDEATSREAPLPPRHIPASGDKAANR
jgi:hypothetical protein